METYHRKWIASIRAGQMSKRMPWGTSSRLDETRVPRREQQKHGAGHRLGEGVVWLIKR